MCVQEMDALQSSTNHSLQAELRERTEHYNQLWLGCQRQLQHELGNVKQGGGTVPPRLSTNNQIKVHFWALDAKIVKQKWNS